SKRQIHNLEINDVPVTPGENVLNEVKDMGKVLNVELHDDLFRAVHRVHSFNKNLTPALINSEPGHRETYFWASIDGKDRWMTKT
ncbi:hypothetical protein J6590_088240, partial [Homalodisca vitripennis]